MAKKTNEEILAGPHSLIGLEAVNVKRIEAAAITFNGEAIAQIVGENGQGKSSLLHAFEWAVGGKKGMQAQPIRRGQDEALMRLDFGEVVVTKRLRANDDGTYSPTLTVAAADGVKFGSPQTVLDAWLGPLTFDPMELVEAAPRDRAEMLRGLVPGFDFAKADKDIKDDRQRREAVGRDMRREKAAAESIQVADDVPETPVDLSELMAEFDAAKEHNAALAEVRDKRTAALGHRAEADRLDALANEIEVRENASKYGDVVVDLDRIRARGSNARAINDQVALRQRRQEHETSAADLERQYDGLTEKIEARERAAAEAIENAKLPIEGLSFVEDDVLLDGLPFDQANTARQLSVAVTLAMALNPSLRVIRIKNGEKLDDKHMRMLDEMASRSGYLILMERVKPADGVGMVVEIEGGKVASIKPEAAAARQKTTKKAAR